MTEHARISVLEANYINIRRQAEDHEERDEDRFDRMFQYTKTRIDEVIDKLRELDDKFTEKFSDLEVKVDNLWDEKNQRHGALKLSNIMAHLITALISIGGAFGILKAMK